MVKAYSQDLTLIEEIGKTKDVQGREYATYSLRKKPASARHLTVASFGKISRKSSQCMRVANPPAEHPERRACGVTKCISNNLQFDFEWWPTVSPERNKKNNSSQMIRNYQCDHRFCITSM